MIPHVPRWQRLLTLMEHGGWVSFREMEQVAGWRFGARLDDLKKKGWLHEHRARGTEGELEYRLFRRAPVGVQTTMALNIQQEAHHE